MDLLMTPTPSFNAMQYLVECFNRIDATAASVIDPIELALGSWEGDKADAAAAADVVTTARQALAECRGCIVRFSVSVMTEPATFNAGYACA